MYGGQYPCSTVIFWGDFTAVWWLVVVLSASPEDCQVLAQVLDSAAEEKGIAQPLDVPKVLETYNEKRLEDAQAACTLSEIAMGGRRTIRPAFAAQMLLMMILNKTLGRLFPKVNTLASSVLCSWTNAIYFLSVSISRDLIKTCDFS